MKQKKWKPNAGEFYYCIILGAFTYIAKRIWDGDDYDEEMFKTYNIFKTKKEAKLKLKLIKEILKK